MTMKKTEVSSSDHAIVMSALDTILSDKIVQQKIVEAIKIVETDEKASYMIDVGSADIEDALESEEYYAKTELSFALLDILEIAYLRKDYYYSAETKVA